MQTKPNSSQVIHRSSFPVLQAFIRSNACDIPDARGLDPEVLISFSIHSTFGQDETSNCCNTLTHRLQDYSRELGCKPLELKTSIQNLSGFRNKSFIRFEYKPRLRARAQAVALASGASPSIASGWSCALGLFAIPALWVACPADRYDGPDYARHVFSSQREQLKFVSAALRKFWREEYVIDGLTELADLWGFNDPIDFAVRVWRDAEVLREPGQQ